MLNRKTPLRSTGAIKRKTPMRRTGFKTKLDPGKFLQLVGDKGIERYKGYRFVRTKLRPVSKRRSTERKDYNRLKAEYLEAHPFDQIYIAIRGLNEDTIIRSDGYFQENGRRYRVARSDQIHHRNKGRGRRLNDTRWWMATSRLSHDLVEDNKEWAREEGYLLPIQADAEGGWGDGNQALETPALMLVKCNP